MARACALVALLSFLYLAVAEEGQATAAQLLAQAIEVQDVCQSLGKDGDYGLELLQKHVTRRAATTGWTKPSSSAALPPAVAPDFSEMISDLGAEVRIGDQRAAGFGLMIEDIQDGLDKAIDAVDEVSASQRKSLADVESQSLSVDSAMKVDLVAKNAEVEAQLAKMAGDAHLRAKHIAEKVNDVQSEFQALNAELNQIQRGDMHVDDLGRNRTKAMKSTVGTTSEGKESRLTSAAAVANAMQQAIKSGDRIRAEEDIQRENLASRDHDLSHNSKEVMKLDAAQKAKSARQLAMRSPKRMKAEEDRQREMRQTQLAIGIKNSKLDSQKQIAMAAKEEAVLGDQVRSLAELESEKASKQSRLVVTSQEQSSFPQEILSAVDDQSRVFASREAVEVAAKVVSAPWVEAASRLAVTSQEQSSSSFSQEAFPVADGQSRVFASHEAVEVAAKLVSAPWVEAARRVEEIMGSATDDRFTATADAMGSVAAVQKKPAAATKPAEFSKEEGLADSAAKAALQAPAQTLQHEAEFAAAAAGVDEAEKHVEMQLEHHKDVYPSIVESEEDDDVEITPEEVAEKWMDSIVQGEQKQIAQVQKKPSVARVAPFFDQRRAAAAAADQVREAAAQTQHEEDEVKAAVAAVEEARDRVTRRLVDHEDLNPTPAPQEDGMILTPEEVAEKWMDSIVQSGQVAGLEDE